MSATATARRDVKPIFEGLHLMIQGRNVHKTTYPISHQLLRFFFSDRGRHLYSALTSSRACRTQTNALIRSIIIIFILPRLPESTPVPRTQSAG